MTAVNVNISKLESQASELMKLIGDVCGILDVPNPVSDLAGSLERSVSQNAHVIAVQAQKLWNRGRIEEVAIGGIALAAAWVGAKGVDFVSNQVAKAKAHEKLRGLYGQLIVKQNLIIDEYTKLSQEQAKEIARLTDDSTSAKENLEKIQKKLEEYSTLLQRITAFRKTVENPS